MSPSPNQDTPPRMPDEVSSVINEYCPRPEEFEITMTMWLIAQDDWSEDPAVKLDHYREFLTESQCSDSGEPVVSDETQKAILAAARQAFHD